MAKFSASLPVILTEIGSDDYPSHLNIQVKFEAHNREEAVGVLRGALQTVVIRAIRERQVPDFTVPIEELVPDAKIRVWGSEEGLPKKSFTINGVRHESDAIYISYETIVSLCTPGESGQPLSVAYYLPGTKGGTIAPGGMVNLADGMHFNVADTGNA